MPVQVQCPNPDCRVSCGVTEAARTGRCPACGWAIGPPSRGTSTGIAPPPVSESGSHPSPYDLPTGGTLGGRYTIVRKIGSGGMGAVYLADDEKLRRRVALKVPHPWIYEDNPEFLLRLEREAQIAAGFQHKNSCPIFDISESDGWHYIVMGYIEGRTLEEVYRHRAVDPAEAARIVRTLAETLHEAHDRGIVHRDLKPSNLMLGPKGELTIMDFGLAKRTDGDESLRTSAGRFLGTMAYASPEQVECRVDQMRPASDIYSLGVILYELLTGRLPFTGPKWEMADQITTVEPVPPSTHRREIGDGLDAVVLRAMSKKPDDRFESMAEFAATLARCFDRPPVVEPRPPEPKKPKPVEPPPRPSPAVEPVPAAVAPVAEPGPREAVSSVGGVEMIRVEPGSFEMGANDGDHDEQPAHRVRIARAFSLGRFAVTQEEYARVVGKSPSHFKDRPRNPVDQVTWGDAIAFCNLLSHRAGLPPFYQVAGKTVIVPDWDAPGVRLPTEAEWEYACRAGKSAKFGFGNDESKLGRFAWYAANSGGKSQPVGTREPNAWGFSDMHGNVWEWCWDWYDANHYAKLESDSPRGPASGKFRILRGGNWGDYATNLRSANRLWFEPSLRLRYIGFRVARNAD